MAWKQKKKGERIRKKSTYMGIGYEITDTHAHTHAHTHTHIHTHTHSHTHTHTYTRTSGQDVMQQHLYGRPAGKILL